MRVNNGLVSISFRGMSVEEIIELCKSADIKYIEWGGDVHVPPNDIENAKRVSELTKEAGLKVSCYGSYFRLGVNPISDFIPVCRTASTLGAPTVRIWAYNKGYEECDEVTSERISEEARKAFEIARDFGLSVNFEYHRYSLTHNIEGAQRLFSECPKENLMIHWQPNPEITVEENLGELKKLPRVDIVHVFAWTFENEENVRHPLFYQAEAWREYSRVALEKNSDCIFELEFFKDDSKEQALKDACSLTEILKN